MTEDPVVELLGQLLFETDKHVAEHAEYKHPQEVSGLAISVLGGMFHSLMHMVSTQPGYGLKGFIPAESLAKLRAIPFEKLPPDKQQEFQLAGKTLVDMLGDTPFRLLLMSMISIYLQVQAKGENADVPEATGGDADSPQ